MISNELLDLLQNNAHVGVLTGAGISAESGLPTFRGAGGLWRSYRAEELATPEGFARDPKLVWEWYCYRREFVKKNKPNPGHYALVKLKRLVSQMTLITQNVDGYHQAAGLSGVVELHGNLMRSRCLQCSSVGENDNEVWKDGLAYCDCEGLRRPDVVWFGESLPAEALEKAFRTAGECSVFFSIGTSALVYPAAQLPQIALNRDAFVVEINPEKTPLTSHVNLFLQGPAGKILPQIVNELEQVKT